jgi:hypothetical protein
VKTSRNRFVRPAISTLVIVKDVVCNICREVKIMVESDETC